ncbi:hypothetical protein GTA08_BOTSDO13730 [Botryosphaeria dothidea]|uniref:Uncharacterized protein n=1 Tax=Botryosphaeria dothidea TaxID=55169 RepID=A0A8H4J217_9PEZI|nr:hypothetical protein GTA08_BOTSDO13730 [Botryosphaeria dothidea]
MADLDTFTNEWTLLKVNTTGMDPKNGTAISASNWVSGDRTDLHLRFIASTTNNIRGIFSYQHQPKTSS